MRNWQNTGVAPGTFLLPGADADMRAWAVIACDQFTAQRDYWERAYAARAGRPSALSLILPEAYLEQSDARVPVIQATMREYLKEGVLSRSVRGMVLTARETASGTRLGVLLCADLEAYDCAPESKSPIRATEETILLRVPPRLRVRAGAPLELSHILLLCDDPAHTVIEPLYARRAARRPLYDIALPEGGGRLRGWAVEDESALDGVFDAIAALKQSLPKDAPLFAVGDGNHSLATARAHWQSVRQTLAPGASHSARYAMCELCNLHDPALIFEPIHRALFGARGADVLGMLAETGAAVTAGAPDVTVVTQAGDTALTLALPENALAVEALQTRLDAWLALHTEARIDYIHGEDAVRALVAQENAVGLLLPAMDKKALFPTVSARGALPRKTFSMGEAYEKRYYVEARRIDEYAEK